MINFITDLSAVKRSRENRLQFWNRSDSCIFQCLFELKYPERPTEFSVFLTLPLTTEHWRFDMSDLPMISPFEYYFLRFLCYFWVSCKPWFLNLNKIPRSRRQRDGYTEEDTFWNKMFEFMSQHPFATLFAWEFKREECICVSNMPQFHWKCFNIQCYLV